MIDGGLRSLFHQKMPWAHWQAIEVGMVGRGVPDTNAAYSQREVWVECKATDGHNVTLRPEQIGWLQRRHRCGGYVFIAVRQARSDLWIISGEWADQVNTLGLQWVRQQGLFRYHGQGGQARWDWGRVSEELFGHRGPDEL